MMTNSDQFATSGNPWMTEKSWPREVADAANPACSSARRRSAQAFTQPAEPRKSTYYVIPAKPEPARPEVCEVRKVLNMRARMGVK